MKVDKAPEADNDREERVVIVVAMVGEETGEAVVVSVEVVKGVVVGSLRVMWWV